MKIKMGLASYVTCYFEDEEWDKLSNEKMKRKTEEEVGTKFL